MKIRAIFVLVAIICTVFAVSVFVSAPQAQAEEGEYDNQHQWHDADWWHKKHPNWTNEHHPEWARRHPEWRNDGDFDDEHHWHDADWWHKKHPNWSHKHHPEWARNHPEWLNDGDFDDQHQWHDRNWWLENRGDWVREHHPDWWESANRGGASSLLERRRVVEIYLYNAQAQYNDAVRRGDDNRAKHLKNAIKADQAQLNSIDQQLHTYGGRPY